jgi:hypothetical protein
MRPLLLFILVAATGGCLFPMNRADMAAANAQHYQGMCANPNRAYEVGYNDGLARKRLDTTWVDTTCTYEMQARVRDGYQAGYQTGIQYAPIVVPVGRGGPTYSSAERCTFSSDCGDGRTCRSNQCIGEGYAGDACWFSSDCLSSSCDLSQKTCK